MKVLHWARFALLFFVAGYALSFAIAASTEYGDLVDAAYLIGILSIPGMAIASLVAVSAQICLAFRRRIGGKRLHG